MKKISYVIKLIVTLSLCIGIFSIGEHNIRAMDTTFNFTIEGRVFTAKQGWDWADWILSYGISAGDNGIAWIGYDNHPNMQHGYVYYGDHGIPLGDCEIVLDGQRVRYNDDILETAYHVRGVDDYVDVINGITNVLNVEETKLGYVDTKGIIHSSNTLAYTKRIPVQTGDTFTLWYYAAGATKTTIRFVTAYDKNGKALEMHGAESVNTYVVPEGVDSLVFTINTESMNKSMIVKNSIATPKQYVAYNDKETTLDVPMGEDFINIFNYKDVQPGYMAPTGAITSSTTLGYSEKITVEEGDVLYIWMGPTSRYAPRFITAFDKEGNAIASAGFSSPSNTYTVPKGITQVVLTVYTASMGNLMVFKNNNEQPPQYIPYEEIIEEPEIIKNINYFDKDSVVSGYMGPNGATSASSSLCYSQKIYVTPNEELSFWNGTNAYAPRFITAFNADGEPLTALGTNSPNKTYIVPEKVDSIVVTVYTSSLNQFMVLKNMEEKPTAYIAYDASLIPTRPTEKPEINDDFTGMEWLYTTGDMHLDTKLSVGKADIITDKHLVFKADITTFTGLRIGHGYTDYVANYIEIDDTSIKEYFYNKGAELRKEVTHGLTITKDIRVSIDVNKRRVATITITSNGNTFTFKTAQDWYGSNGEIYAQSLNSELKNAHLAWTCDGYKKDIQFYGDSYLSQSSDRWLSYAFDEGNSNALFDAFGGRGSTGAYASLVENLKHSNPKIVVWMMGMNDGSDINETTPSQAWSQTRDKLIELSKEEGFELIFTTIPTVPTINHEAKNTWIRNSGYRYIDMAQALGADGSGQWTEGYLHTDGVHPTATGAQAIYQAVLHDFPEIKE